jgi:hypothetical protein
MAGRLVRDAIGLIVASFAALVLPRSVIAAGNNLSAPPFSLAALLTVAPDLPMMSRSVLMSEAERIWRREGVALQWSKVPDHDAPSAALRVLVISRREAVMAGSPKAWTVGELVPHGGQRPLAIASIAGAERVLDASGSRVLHLDKPELVHYRLGIVLGRAVAHEIGHYLLATATHADHGLMRASIDAREFADPGARTFTLDEAAGDWLRNRLESGPLEARLPSAGFTYAAPTESPTPVPEP